MRRKFGAKLARAAKASAAALLATMACGGCFGILHDPPRHYYVLHVPTRTPLEQGKLGGLIRVRDVDTESAFDRLQMVVRKSDFELAFRPRDTWAVKPGRMVSDVLARALAEAGAFDSVTRELSEQRPDFLLSGELHALEVEQKAMRWQAHLGVNLQLTDTDAGEVLWTAHYDEREPCAARDYGAAVQAFSTALERIVASATGALRALPPGATGPSPQPALRTAVARPGH